VHLTDTEPTLGYAFGAFGPVFVTPQALPPAVAGELSASLVITSDVSPSTVERIRDAFPPGVLATTIQEQASFAARVYDGYVRAVVLGLVMAITVGAASLAVSTADSARERRRSTAALVAIGVLLRTVRGPSCCRWPPRCSPTSCWPSEQRLRPARSTSTSTPATASPGPRCRRRGGA